MTIEELKAVLSEQMCQRVLQVLTFEGEPAPPLPTSFVMFYVHPKDQAEAFYLWILSLDILTSISLAIGHLSIEMLLA